MPDFAPAWARLAAVARAEGRSADAVAALEKAASLDFFGEKEDARVTFMNLAGVYQSRGRGEEALAAARRAAGAMPGDADARRMVCRILDSLGRPGSAADGCAP